MCLSSGKSTTRFGVSPFFRRKVTIFIGRETKTHIFPTKINETRIGQVSPFINNYSFRILLPFNNTQHTTHNTQHTTHNTQHTTHNTQQQQRYLQELPEVQLYAENLKCVSSNPGQLLRVARFTLLMLGWLVKSLLLLSVFF